MNYLVLKMNIYKRISIVVAFSSCLAGAANANDIVQNGSFSTGLTGWTSQGFGVNYSNVSGPMAATGCVGSWCIDQNGAYISQVLTTTIGQTYNLTFSLTNNGGPVNEVAVHWGDSQVFDLKNWAATQDHSTDTIFNDYAVTGLVATGTSITLRFNGRQDPYGMGIDNISVVAAPVPEPETYAMLLAGLGLIGTVVNRSKSKQA